MWSLQILASALHETMTAPRAVFWGILFYKKDIRFESDIFKNVFCLCHILSSSLSHVFVQVRFWVKLKWPKGTKPCLLSKQWPCWQLSVLAIGGSGERKIGKFTLQQQNSGIAPLPQAGKRRDKEKRSRARCSFLAHCPSPWQKKSRHLKHTDPHTPSPV